MVAHSLERVADLQAEPGSADQLRCSIEPEDQQREDIAWKRPNGQVRTYAPDLAEEIAHELRACIDVVRKQLVHVSERLRTHLPHDVQ